MGSAIFRYIRALKCLNDFHVHLLHRVFGLTLTDSLARPGPQDSQSQVNEGASTTSSRVLHFLMAAISGGGGLLVPALTAIGTSKHF